MSDRRLSTAVFVLVVTAHIVAFLQFRSVAVELKLPARWSLQILTLFLLSVSISGVLALFKLPGVVLVLLGVRMSVLLISGVPLGEDLMIEFSLLTSVIIELFAYSTIPNAAAFSTATIGIVVASQRPTNVLGHLLPAAPIFDILSFTLYAAFVAILCGSARFFHAQYASGRQAEGQLKEATLRLAQTNMELQEYAAVSEQRAVEGERKRLARDVHDTLAYTLTNLIMMMEAAGDMAPTSAAALREHLQRARDQAQAGLLEVRRTVRAIRESPAQTVTGLRAIHRLITSFGHATHIDIELRMGDAPWSFGQTVDAVVFRLVQEGITNALRHGAASRITISFQQEGSGVRVSIMDNGIGFSEMREGFGLLGIQERIAHIGGRTEIHSRPDEGTRLNVWIPLDGGETRS